MTPAQIEFYKRLAHGLALQFGPNCEVVVHDLETEDVDHSIVVIENGHVSGRKLGDGPSHIVFESMHEGTTDVHDREPYLTKTTDGKLLKSSTIFIRNDEGKPVGILGINFDITLMKAFERSLDAFTGTGGTGLHRARAHYQEHRRPARGPAARVRAVCGQARGAHDQR